MKRIIFDDCAGWLHAANGRTGVVLCAPLGHEALWTHRALRHLADDLAAAGVPVLRFDYPGCGDSAGAHDDPDLIGRCQRSIVGAARLLRSLTHVDHVVLCGLRMGATLAVLAAEAMRDMPSNPVAGLVLLAPVTHGRAYLREIRALHTNWLNVAVPLHRPTPHDDGSLSALSFRMSARAVATLEPIRLEQRVPVCADVLLLDPWPGVASVVARLERHYHAHGTRVSTLPFPEYADTVQSAETAGVPEQAWREVVAWIRTLVPAQAGAAEPVAAPAGHPPPEVADVADVADVDGAIEYPVWLDRGRIFGILALPACGRAETAIIFPNTGGNHHVGDGRLFVTLSRRLARHGIAALRMDLSTHGDSAMATRTMSVPAIYTDACVDDVSAAADWMHARGFRHIGVAGICGGAFHGFNAALQNPHIDTLVLANLLRFRSDQTVTISVDRIRPTRAYLQGALRLYNWKRVFKREIPVWRVLRKLGTRVRHHLSHWMARHATQAGEAAEPADSLTAFVRHGVRELGRRKVVTTFLYGADDAGLLEAHRHFGSRLEGLNGLDTVSVEVIDRFDHSLFLPESQEVFCERVLRQLRKLRKETGAEAVAEATQ